MRNVYYTIKTPFGLYKYVNTINFEQRTLYVKEELLA